MSALERSRTRTHGSDNYGRSRPHSPLRRRASDSGFELVDAEGADADSSVPKKEKAKRMMRTEKKKPPPAPGPPSPSDCGVS